MKIIIKVKTRAKEEKIEKISESGYKVCVKEPADKGLANEAVIKALARYFDIPQGRVSIVAGFKSKSKIIEIK